MLICPQCQTKQFSSDVRKCYECDYAFAVDASTVAKRGRPRKEKPATMDVAAETASETAESAGPQNEPQGPESETVVEEPLEPKEDAQELFEKMCDVLRNRNTITVDFGLYPELKDYLFESAKSDFREPEMQILALLHDAREIKSRHRLGAQ